MMNYNSFDSWIWWKRCPQLMEYPCLLNGLGRTLSVYRLPEADWVRHLMLAHYVTFNGGSDLPVYVRVTQADGHRAWSSPIYLIE